MTKIIKINPSPCNMGEGIKRELNGIKVCWLYSPDSAVVEEKDCEFFLKLNGNGLKINTLPRLCSLVQNGEIVNGVLKVTHALTLDTTAATSKVYSDEVVQRLCYQGVIALLELENGKVSLLGMSPKSFQITPLHLSKITISEAESVGIGSTCHLKLSYTDNFFNNTYYTYEQEN